MKGVPPVRMRYLASSRMIPVCPWFPPPRVVGIAAAITIVSFLRVVRSFAISCPKILVANSLLTSSLVSDRIPIFDSFVCLGISNHS